MGTILSGIPLGWGEGMAQAYANACLRQLSKRVANRILLRLFSSHRMRVRFKHGVSLVLLVVACALLWSAYAPERWLAQIRRLAKTSAGEMPDGIPKPQPAKQRIEGRAPNEVANEIWRMASVCRRRRSVAKLCVNASIIPIPNHDFFAVSSRAHLIGGTPIHWPRQESFRSPEMALVQVKKPPALRQPSAVKS